MVAGDSGLLLESSPHSTGLSKESPVWWPIVAVWFQALSSTLETLLSRPPCLPAHPGGLSAVGRQTSSFSVLSPGRFHFARQRNRRVTQTAPGEMTKKVKWVQVKYQ